MINLSKALKTFDKVVQDIETCGDKYWELLFWGMMNSSDEKTCVVVIREPFAQIIKQSMQRNIGI